MIDREILKYSYWEHFKRAKELSLILPLKHPQRIAIEKEMNIITEQLKQSK